LSDLSTNTNSQKKYDKTQKKAIKIIRNQNCITFELSVSNN